MADLIRQGRTYTVPKGEIVLSTEDNKSLQMVKEGYIKRYQITNTGNISIQSIYGPKEVFPLTYVFRLLFNKSIYSGPETYYYEAMTRTSLYSLDGGALVEAIKTDPLLYGDLLLVAADRFQSNIHQLENISLGISYTRVAHQLWFFANKFSEKKGDSAKIKIPLTQQDMADVLSTTRETVSLCMSQLRKKKLIKTGKYISVPSIEKLKLEAFEAR